MLKEITLRKKEILCLAIIAFIAVLAVIPAAAQEMMVQTPLGKDSFPLMTTPFAKNAGLENVVGFAEVDSKDGTVNFAVTLPEGTSLPAGSVLEGWLVSAGCKGGPGPSSSSQADHIYGPSFGVPLFSMTARDIPYSLSTGILLRKGSTNTYVGRFRIQNSLTPYSAATVTIETDGNLGFYDPRPGTPLLKGVIKGGMMDGKMMDGKMMDGKMMDGKMMDDGMRDDKMMDCDKMMKDEMMKDKMMKDKMMKDKMMKDKMMKDKKDN